MSEGKKGEKGLPPFELTPLIPDEPRRPGAKTLDRVEGYFAQALKRAAKITRAMGITPKNLANDDDLIIEIDVDLVMAPSSGPPSAAEMQLYSYLESFERDLNADRLHTIGFEACMNNLVEELRDLTGKQDAVVRSIVRRLVFTYQKNFPNIKALFDWAEG